MVGGESRKHGIPSHLPPGPVEGPGVPGDRLQWAPAVHSLVLDPGTRPSRFSEQPPPLRPPGPGAGGPRRCGSGQPPGSQPPSRNPGEPLGRPGGLCGVGGQHTPTGAPPAPLPPPPPGQRDPRWRPARGLLDRTPQGCRDGDGSQPTGNSPDTPGTAPSSREEGRRTGPLPTHSPLTP